MDNFLKLSVLQTNVQSITSAENGITLTNEIVRLTDINSGSLTLALGKRPCVAWQENQSQLLKKKSYCTFHVSLTT